ncbi:MAG TPA: hypothetical protein VGB55_12900 [Tepidisphaeraceae bacterium]|jgi:hypothetical protein
MFRHRKKIDRDHRIADRPDRTLNYAAPESEEQEPKRPFWPDREGWKQLGWGCLAHGIIEPLLIILLVLLGLQFFGR